MHLMQAKMQMNQCLDAPLHRIPQWRQAAHLCLGVTLEVARGVGGNLRLYRGGGSCHDRMQQPKPDTRGHERNFCRSAILCYRKHGDAPPQRQQGPVGMSADS